MKKNGILGGKMMNNLGKILEKGYSMLKICPCWEK